MECIHYIIELVTVYQGSTVCNQINVPFIFLIHVFICLLFFRIYLFTYCFYIGPQIDQFLYLWVHSLWQTA